eukprot:3822132-Amphidinium_carterae.1
MKLVPTLTPPTSEAHMHKVATTIGNLVCVGEKGCEEVAEYCPQHYHCRINFKTQFHVTLL